MVVSLPITQQGHDTRMTQLMFSSRAKTVESSTSRALQLQTKVIKVKEVIKSQNIKCFKRLEKILGGKKKIIQTVVSA